MTDFERVQRVLKFKGWQYFDNGKPYNLNIVGIRSENRRAGRFDDVMMLSYRNKVGALIVKWLPFTADPGVPWLLKPMVSEGTLILFPGQHRAAFTLGIHGRSWKKGSYKALEQIRELEYIRDGNRDDILDMPNSDINCDIVAEAKRLKLRVVRGNFKTNIHRAHPYSVSDIIGNHSAGCQVIKDPKDYDELILTADNAINSGFRNVFTYTLIHEKWLKQI
jgi:hypothetical protein